MPTGVHGSNADDDEVAANAARLLAGVAEAFREDLGARPTLAELVEILGWAVPSREPSFEAPAGLAACLVEGLRVASAVTADPVDGVVASDVVEPTVAKRLKVGDVVAIPEGGAGYRIAVVVARNVWGHRPDSVTTAVSQRGISRRGARR